MNLVNKLSVNIFHLFSIIGDMSKGLYKVFWAVGAAALVAVPAAFYMMMNVCMGLICL